ncbi:hypothetical protein [Faecalibacterium wellingii]|uniref:hypothetical protein n=1 Tax=Faecalibacterium wellingii TaxID=2929491 RepID=UPI0039BD74B6
MKNYEQNPEPFQSQNGSKRVPGFYFLHYLFVQAAIAFLFCNSPVFETRGATA